MCRVKYLKSYNNIFHHWQNKKLKMDFKVSGEFLGGFLAGFKASLD